MPPFSFIWLSIIRPVIKIATKAEAVPTISPEIENRKFFLSLLRAMQCVGRPRSVYESLVNTLLQKKNLQSCDGGSPSTVTTEPMDEIRKITKLLLSWEDLAAELSIPVTVENIQKIKDGVDTVLTTYCEYVHPEGDGSSKSKVRNSYFEINLNFHFHVVSLLVLLFS